MVRGKREEEGGREREGLREREIRKRKEVVWERKSSLALSLFRIIEAEIGKREGERERGREGVIER